VEDAAAIAAPEEAPESPSPAPLIPEVLPPEPAEPHKKRGRKPGTKVIRLKNGRIRAIAPKEQPSVLSQAEPGSKLSKLLREHMRAWLEGEIGWLQNETKRLVTGASREEQPQVSLVMKLWDKLLPDAKEAGGAGEASVVNIQINNVNRGRPTK